MIIGDRVRIARIARLPDSHHAHGHVGREGLIASRHRCVPASKTGGWKVDVDLFETCVDCARRVTVPEDCLEAAPLGQRGAGLRTVVADTLTYSLGDIAGGWDDVAADILAAVFAPDARPVLIAGLADAGIAVQTELRSHDGVDAYFPHDNIPGAHTLWILADGTLGGGPDV